MPRQLLFSVTSHDMEWEFFRCGGNGGQNVNKRSTGARCRHIPSGAVGEGRSARTQAQNRKIAFQHCTRKPAFTAWLRVEAARRMGTLVDIDAVVDESMSPANIRIDLKVNGKWTPEG